VLPRGLRGLLVAPRKSDAQNLAARLQLFLLRLLELEISFPDHGVERPRLSRRLDAGADGRSTKTARVVDRESHREPGYDRVLQVLQFLRHVGRGVARLARSAR